MICSEYCDSMPPTSSIKAPDTYFARDSTRRINVVTFAPHRPRAGHRHPGAPSEHPARATASHSDHTAPTSKGDAANVSTIIPDIALVVILAYIDGVLLHHLTNDRRIAIAVRPEK